MTTQQLPLSRYMPERIKGGVIHYLSYPTNAEGFFDEKTGKRTAKEPDMASAAADGYDMVDEEPWNWDFGITSFAIRDQFTQYTITCSAFGVDWTATTRYSEMLQLVNTLYSANLISLEEYNNFPAKAPFVWSVKETFVLDRRMRLNKFFQQLFLANPGLMRQPRVLRWLKAPPRVVDEVLVQSAAESDFGTVQLILNSGIDVNTISSTTGWTALHHAARNGDEQLVRQLLDRAADTNVKVEPRGEHNIHVGWTPLCFACANGHHVVAHSLLVNHANVNAETADNNTPLMLAVKGQFPAVLRILLSRPELNLSKAFESEIFNGAHLNALHVAAQLGNATLLKMLLDKGMDVNGISDPNGCPGWTPLHWAAQTGQPDAVELLLQRGANPTLKTSVKYNLIRTAKDTPADIASMFGHEQVARRLMDAAEVWKALPSADTGSSDQQDKSQQQSGQQQSHQQQPQQQTHTSDGDRHLLKFLSVRSSSGENAPDKDKDRKQQQSREKRLSTSDRLTSWLMGEDLIEAQKAAAAAAAAGRQASKDVPAEGASIHTPANGEDQQMSSTSM